MANEDEQKSAQQQPESERKFSQQQYDLLKRCSDKKDMTDWNKWQEEHWEEGIWLQGVDLNGAHLENAELWNANLENADLREAHLENANLWLGHMVNANLMGVHLENANLSGAHLEHAWGNGAYLRGACFSNAKLQGANFSAAIVDGETIVWDCEVDNKTNFMGVGLDSARIEPETKQILEYNIRRMNWEQWYRGKSENILIIRIHQLLTLPVRLFWYVSNYGLSTWRIIFTFFILAFFFAAIYYVCGILNPPGIVSSLFEGKERLVPVWLVPFRTIYFSIVTMTTLGFGDMHANCQSFLGHLLLTVQVILGYALLGALVTRFAVLFTVGGPAGKFAPTKTKEEEKIWLLK